MRKIIFHLILITIFNNTNIFTFNTVIHHHVLNYSIYYIHRIVVLLGTDEKKCSNRLVVQIKYKDLKKNEKGYKIVSLKIHIFTLVVRPCQRQKEEKAKKM